MDYPVSLSTQLKHFLRSLRKARGLTQAELAARLGVGQSRVADIEANPGAVSVEQLMHVLSMLNAQLVVRDELPVQRAGAISATAETPATETKTAPPKGQW